MLLGAAGSHAGPSGLRCPLPRRPLCPPHPSPSRGYPEKLVKLTLIPHQEGQVEDEAEALPVGSVTVGVIWVNAWKSTADET